MTKLEKLTETGKKVIDLNNRRNKWNKNNPKIRYNDVTIIRNSGDGRTYFTVEVDTHFTRKQAEKFYTYISLYHLYDTKTQERST